MRLRGGFRSKHERTIASATVTFWCITVVPAGAPMIDADQVADAEDRVPPALAPRARAARRPLARELLQPPLRLGGHRAERVVDQVRRRLEDREAIAVVGELGHASATIASISTAHAAGQLGDADRAACADPVLLAPQLRDRLREAVDDGTRERARARVPTCRSCARPRRARRPGSTTIGPGPAGDRPHDAASYAGSTTTTASASMHGTQSLPVRRSPSRAGCASPCTLPSTFSVRASTRVTTFVSCETYSDAPKPVTQSAPASFTVPVMRFVRGSMPQQLPGGVVGHPQVAADRAEAVRLDADLDRLDDLRAGDARDRAVARVRHPRRAEPPLDVVRPVADAAPSPSRVPVRASIRVAVDVRFATAHTAPGARARLNTRAPTEIRFATLPLDGSMRSDVADREAAGPDAAAARSRARTSTRRRRPSSPTPPGEQGERGDRDELHRPSVAAPGCRKRRLI